MDREETIQLVIESMGRLQRSADPVLWRKAGLSHAEVSMLYRLHFHPGASMKRLSSDMGVSKSAVTQLVESLVAKRFVKRSTDPLDRRIVILQITPAGNKLIGQLKRHKSEGLRAAMASLTDSDLKKLSSIFIKMSDRN